MKKILPLLLSMVLAILLAGCGGQGAKQEEGKKETTLERVKRQGYVTVGFANEKPYAYATPDGKLTGEAVEVARAALKNMGINEMQGVLTEFGSLIPGLQAKRFDMVTAGMFITPERAKQVDFANPEYKIGQALAVKAGNPKNLHSYEDIAANPDVKVAVMGGGIEYDYLIDVGASKNQLVIVPDQPSAVEALLAGRVDATTMTGPSLQAQLDVKKDPRIERVTDFKQPVIKGKNVIGYGATAFRQEDDDFREAFNQELDKLKKSGELLKAIRPFGFTEENLPGEMTAEEVVKTHAQQ